jgi:hypothetical protein
MGFSENCEHLLSEIFRRGSDPHWIIEVDHENRRAVIFFPENKCEFTLETTLDVNVYDNFKSDNREADMTQWGLFFHMPEFSNPINHWLGLLIQRDWSLSLSWPSKAFLSNGRPNALGSDFGIGYIIIWFFWSTKGLLMFTTAEQAALLLPSFVNNINRTILSPCNWTVTDFFPFSCCSLPSRGHLIDS